MKSTIETLDALIRKHTPKEKETSSGYIQVLLGALRTARDNAQYEQNQLDAEAKQALTAAGARPPRRRRATAPLPRPAAEVTPIAHRPEPIASLRRE